MNALEMGGHQRCTCGSVPPVSAVEVILLYVLWCDGEASRGKTCMKVHGGYA